MENELQEQEEVKENEEEMEKKDEPSGVAAR